MPHISFQSHLENISSWKAGSPASNPRRLEPSFAAVIEEQSVYCNNSWRPQLRDQTLCFSAWDWSFFCSCNKVMGMMQQECRTGGAYCGSQGPQASVGEWRLWYHKRHGFPRHTFRTYLFSALIDLFSKMSSWKAGSHSSNAMLDNRSLVCSSHVSQLRAQSISCNPNLGHNHCILRNKSWRPQLRDQTLCFSAWDWFLSSAATKGWAWCKHNAELMQRAAALTSLKLLGGIWRLRNPKRKWREWIS